MESHSNRPDLNLKSLALSFERFAEKECRGSSPLDKDLSLSVASDAAGVGLAVGGSDFSAGSEEAFVAMFFFTSLAE